MFKISAPIMKMVAKTIKEIIIMLVVALITMLLLAILLYQYIPSKKVVPQITEYHVSESVQDLLEDDIDNRSNQDQIILTYEVTSSDLRNYQTTKDYVPGKSNPFAAYTKTITEEEANGVSSNVKEDTGGTSTNKKSGTNSSSSDTQTLESANTGYSQDKGTK